MVPKSPEPALLVIRKAVRADADAAWEIRRAAVMSECAGVYPLDQLEQWTGGTASTIFDSGLTDAKHRPRPGYVIVCAHLHGAHCKVKVSSQ